MSLNEFQNIKYNNFTHFKSLRSLPFNYTLMALNLRFPASLNLYSHRPNIKIQEYFHKIDINPFCNKDSSSLKA